MMDGGDRVTSALDALYLVRRRLMHAEAEVETCDVAVSAVPDVFDVPFDGLWLYDSELLLPQGERGVLSIASEDADAVSQDERQVARVLSANIESALAIVKRIVEAHGWGMRAGDSVDRGARFGIFGQTRSVTPFQTESQR
ncbi:ATP-binding protein [Haloarcula salinisoli]|uniref:ATP-binding protein n=1 Tax=Haloarcula salinisoli TaxID=2487746 RepID=A0A8J7YD31_9EURY|nr:ATP-binding protein [Halomicroarcula salinisoli]MBX0303302.1 ATP-binding protein [Halomicroarcula salinisoli]